MRASKIANTLEPRTFVIEHDRDWLPSSERISFLGHIEATFNRTVRRILGKTIGAGEAASVPELRCQVSCATGATPAAASLCLGCLASGRLTPLCLSAADAAHGMSTPRQTLVKKKHNRPGPPTNWWTVRSVRVHMGITSALNVICWHRLINESQGGCE